MTEGQDDRYADLLPAPQGELQIADAEPLILAEAVSASPKSPAQVLGQPWPVWRCCALLQRAISP